MKRRVVALAVLIAAASAAPAAHAAPWKRVTTPDGASTDQVGLARTADGVLHVAWHHPTGPNTEDLLHTAISSAGKVGATSPVQSGWTGFTNPALVVDPGGLRAFWGGFRSTDSSDPQNETNTALSADGGASWALQPGSVVPLGAQSYASNTAATVRADGSTLQAFAGTLGTWVHAGLSPVTPNHDYQAPLGPYGYDPNLATDASDRTVLAWYSNASGHLGVHVQDVAADGAPVGGAATMPNTSNMQVGMLGRTPLVARKGGGLYVAYPTGYPTAEPRAAVACRRVRRAADRQRGRLEQPGRGARGGRRRAAVGRLDGRVRGPGRAGAAVQQGRDEVRRDGERRAPQGRRAGVQGRRERGRRRARRARQLQHRHLDDRGHLLPPPAPRPDAAGQAGKLRKGKKTDVRFTVRDAGAAVKGAKVKAGGRSGTTNAKGRVTLTIKSGKAVTAKATRSGYTGATKRLKLRG